LFGAVKGACDHARLGNLTALINKIEPAVAAVTEPKDEALRNSSNIDFVNEVAKKNVLMTIDQIRKESSVLATMEKEGDIKIVGGMYDIKTGAVKKTPVNNIHRGFYKIILSNYACFLLFKVKPAKVNSKPICIINNIQLVLLLPLISANPAGIHTITTATNIINVNAA